MSKVLFTNNATTTLAAHLSSTATNMTLASGTGSLFPSINSGSGDYFYVTIINSNGQYEIVKVTARSSDVCTIVRAQDGTSATTFVIGDKVELRLVSAALSNLSDKIDDITSSYLPRTGGTLSGNINFSQTGDTTLWKTKSAARFVFRGGGSNFQDGASLYLHGKDYTTDPGAALIYAHDGTNSAWIKLTPDGKMFVRSNEVLTAAGGSVRQLMSIGELALTRSVDNNRLWISGGTDMTSGALILYGKDHAEYANEARLKAGNTQLRILPAGGATLGGYKVLTEASGTASVSEALAVSAVVTGSTEGKTFTLPDIGTWAYTYHRYTHGDNSGGSGIAGGGTTITADENCITYFAIRIA